TEAKHGFFVRNAWEGRRRNALAVRKFFGNAMKDRFDRIENVSLSDEAHLEVQLIELPWRAVRTCIFIAEARCDLEVPVKACDHQKLLEHLWCLRQRVELTWVQSRRNQEVSSPFRAGCRQNGRLEFREALVNHT